MSRLDNLLNTNSLSKKSASIINVDVNDIERNVLNKAPIDDIEIFAESIKRDGIKNPLIGYKLDNGKYRLISGERRWTVAKYLNLDTVPLYVIQKPINEIEERLIILNCNSQRSESKEYIEERVKEYEEIYFKLAASGQAPQGRKRDWIAEQMGRAVTGRTVQNYLKPKVDKSKEKPKISELEKLEKKLLGVIRKIDNESLQIENYKIVDLIYKLYNEIHNERGENYEGQ